MERPRVLHIITRLGVGGAARHVIDASRRMLDDFDVTIAAGPEEESEGSLRKEAAGAGIPVRSLARMRRQGSILSDRRALKELVETIQSVRPVLVHTHQAKAGVLGRMAAKRAGVRRMVHTFHSPLERLGRDGLLLRANITAERRLARATDRLIAVSRSLRDELVAQEVVPPDRIDVILPLVEPRRLFEPSPASGTPGRFGLPASAPVVGFVGRLAAAKDPGLFLKVFTTVASCIPDAHGVVVGDGPERADLEAEARRRGLARRVLFTGWSVDPAGVYQHLDVLLVPSRYEGFSTAALGAMASGCAVVGTHVTGIVDMIDDGRTGLLASSGDVGALAGAVILLLRDAGYRARMAAAARAEALARFGDEDASPRLAALYGRLLGLPVHRPARSAARRAEAAT